MKRIYLLLTFITWCVLGLVGCSSDVQNEPIHEINSDPMVAKERVDIPFPENQKSAVRILSGFANKFTYDALTYHDSSSELNRSENMIISPLSATMVFFNDGEWAGRKWQEDLY